MDDSDLMCLDTKYSTTRLLTQEKPIIENGENDKFKSVLFLPKGDDRKGEGGLRTQGYFKSSLKDKPLITIITVVFNGEKYLEETILSVINQSYDNVEYIIIDGGSTDGTLDMIKKYEGQIDYWVSERDAGIYDAMNKGIKLAYGEIIGILNADDWYHSDAVFNSSSVIRDENAGFSYGKVYLVKRNGMVYGSTRPLDDKEIKKRIYKEMPYPHPSVFVAKFVYKKIGVFNKTYKLSADYEFLLRLFIKNYKGVNTNQYISYFRDGGESGGVKTFNETRKIVILSGKSKLFSNLNFILSLFRAVGYKFLPDFIIKLIRKLTKSKHSLEAK